MTDEYDYLAVRELRRDIATILDGHTQPLVGTALVICVADWLRQHNPPDVEPVQRDQVRIALLMRFLKGVAEEIGLGFEFGQLDDDDEIRFDA